MENDFYSTPSNATLELLKREQFNGSILECACGTGANDRDIGCFLSEDENYAKVFYIKIKKEEYKDKIVKLLKNVKWKEIYPMTAVPNLTQTMVYKYILEKIKEV